MSVAPPAGARRPRGSSPGAGLLLVFALWFPALLPAAVARAAEPPTLLSALGCPACHTDLDVPTDVATKAPPLGDAGLRYRPAYLFDFLRSPRSVRRHIEPTRMPNFHLSDQEALALTAFLETQTALPNLPALPEDLDEPIAPEERFETDDAFLAVIGTEQDCLACHARGRSGGVLGPDLKNAGARLTPGWMRRFLLAPSAWDVPDGTMPALFLREDENGVRAPVEADSVSQLRRIVDYIDRSGETERARLEERYAAARAGSAEIRVADGRRIFEALACRACHRVGTDPARIEPAPDLRIEKERVRPAWLATYLSHPWPIRPFGPRPGNGQRMPDFGLSLAEVERIVAELGRPAPVEAADEEAALTAYQASKARRFLQHDLPCLGCHRFEGAGGQVGPDLTNARARLQPSFIRAMIADPTHAVPRAVMPALPLDEKRRSLVARFLGEDRPATPTTYLSLVEHHTIPLPPTAGAARDYARYCAPCHGDAGRGDGFNASYLPVTPTAHADASLMSLRADDTLFDGIAGGGQILDRSHFMPAWGETLSDERISALVRYIRDLCDCEPPAWSVRGRDPSARVSPAHERTPVPALLSAHDSLTFDDFVGAEACAECHAEEYEVWRASTHARAGGVPGEAEIVAAFDGEPRHFRNGTLRPVATDDGRYVFEVRQDGAPDIDVEVAAAIGGGHMVGGGTQAFFAAMADGTFRMLPFDFHKGRDTWFVQHRSDSHWTPIGDHVGLDELTHWPPFRALGNMPRLSHCENCHGSQILVEYDEETQEFSTRWKSLRIDCESCHGPGRKHIAWARSEDRVQNPEIAIDPLDVLDKNESLQVCFRCHANKQVLTNRYLAGMDPLEHFAFKHPMLAQGAYLADGRVDGFGYQQNHIFSDCFVEGSMVCTDCHDPHSQTYRDVNGRALEGRFDDAQCTSCHAAKALDVPSHTHHPAGSPGSRCVACHMPYLQHQIIGDEFVFARSDHTIPIPRPVFDESLGIENACAKCHADEPTAALQADVDRWWGPAKPHHPMIDRILRADGVTDASAAASLLLAPEESHIAAQMAGVSAFVRGHVRTTTPLPPSTIRRLLALSEAPDPDIAAVAVVALHVGAAADPQAAARVDEASTARGKRARALRRRWRFALTDLVRLRARQGERAEAKNLQAKKAELEGGR